MDNCQYEVLELKDLVFVHDFCKQHLLVEDSSSNEICKDKYNEQEMRTIGWPVSMLGNDEFKGLPFAMLRPIKNPHYNS